MTSYYILAGVIMLLAMVITIGIGLSKSNREGNPEYDQRTAGNWLRLSALYVISAVVALAALFIFIKN